MRTPQDRLAAALSEVPDACREVLALLKACQSSRQPSRLTLVLEVDRDGRIKEVEVPKRFTRRKGR